MLARAFSQQVVAVPSKASGSGFDRLSTPFFLQGCRVDTNADTPKALPAHDISLASDEPFLPTGRRLASVPSQRLLTRARSARQAKLFERDANSVRDMACTPESFLLDPALAPSPPLLRPHSPAGERPQINHSTSQTP